MTYAINKTHGHLSLKSGYLVIPKAGFIEVSEADKAEPSFVHAESRKWLEYSDEKPETVEVAAIQVASVDPRAGLTAEQLKEALANKEEVPTGTAEPIGNSGLNTGEPAVTKLGGEAGEGLLTPPTQEPAAEQAEVSTEGATEGEAVTDEAGKPARASRKKAAQ